MKKGILYLLAHYDDVCLEILETKQKTILDLFSNLLLISWLALADLSHFKI